MTLQERWAAQDAFIGPRLPAPWCGYWEEREDRVVLASGGLWYAEPRPALTGSCQGPFCDLLEARSAPLKLWSAP